MKPIQVDENYVEDAPIPWVFRYPSASLTILVATLAGMQVLATHWIEDQQAPQWRQVNKSIEVVAVYQLEQDRWIGLALGVIAKSAGVEMPDRPPQLDRAAVRVRDVREGTP